MALKHTQDTPVEKAARRWVISTPSVVDVGAESNVALLRSPDRHSFFDTWQAGTLTVTQAGCCVKRRVLAATAIAAGWRGFSARWPLVARYNFWVARYNVRCEQQARARHDHDASRAKVWRDAALRSHNAKHHGAPPLTHHDATVGPLARVAHCSVRTLLPWHASTTPQALQTKADGRPSKAAAQHTGSLATFFRAQSILLNKQVSYGLLTGYDLIGRDFDAGSLAGVAA
eukprot:scaffold37218_cov58-Phaeocystis_antarctica.AAC.2